VNGKQFAVYILASKRNGMLYTGFTGDLVKRVWEHKQQFVDGFKIHNVSMLVYFELHDEISICNYWRKTNKGMEERVDVKFNRR